MSATRAAPLLPEAYRLVLDVGNAGDRKGQKAFHIRSTCDLMAPVIMPFSFRVGAAVQRSEPKSGS